MHPDDTTHNPFDAERLLGVLGEEGVAYVLIGGYAAQLHGAGRPTVDIDVTPARDHENLTRLTAALQRLNARIRTPDEPEGLPFATSAAALRGLKMLNLVTKFGELDLAFPPAGTDGYESLSANATPHTIGTLVVRVASLDDVIRSKETANRAKDLDALPELHHLADRQRATKFVI